MTYSYETGDHLGVFPSNQKEIVAEIADKLKMDLKQNFRYFNPPKTPITPDLPSVVSVETFLKKYCDLEEILRRPTIGLCAQHSTKQSEKEVLQQMCALTDEGKV
jgi:sulfite reductase alpha subunit-like flavoprotein